MPHHWRDCLLLKQCRRSTSMTCVNTAEEPGERQTDGNIRIVLPSRYWRSANRIKTQMLHQPAVTNRTLVSGRAWLRLAIRHAIVRRAHRRTPLPKRSAYSQSQLATCGTLHDGGQQCRWRNSFSSFFPREAYIDLLSVGSTAQTRCIMASLLDVVTGRNLVNRLFHPSNWLAHVKRSKHPLPKTPTWPEIPVKYLFSLKICIGNLHTGPSLGIFENPLVDILLARNLLTSVFLTSSQPSKKLSRYTTAWWGNSRPYQGLCQFPCGTSKTTRDWTAR